MCNMQYSQSILNNFKTHYGFHKRSKKCRKGVFCYCYMYIIHHYTYENSESFTFRIPYNIRWFITLYYYTVLYAFYDIQARLALGESCCGARKARDLRASTCGPFVPAITMEMEMEATDPKMKVFQHHNYMGIGDSSSLG